MMDLTLLSQLLQRLRRVLQPDSVGYIGGSDKLPPPLDREAEARALEDLLAGSSQAKSLLIEHNLRLVVYIARRFENTGVGLEDLISIGTIGLIKAVSTYTAGRATRLATYAAKCIENEILMSIRASKRIKQEVSLSLPIGTDKDGNEISFNDILGTDTDEIVEDISLKIQVAKLYRAIAKQLSPREQRVIIQRYGLDGGEARPQREIAKQLGISRSYVSRIEKRALEKLRSGLTEI